MKCMLTYSGGSMYVEPLPDAGTEKRIDTLNQALAISSMSKWIWSLVATMIL